MADIPPRYQADLEDTLMIPSTDQQSVSSRSPSRRWDDPPEEEPDAPAENITTMVFIKAFDIRTYLESEILSLTFTPNDTHIAAVTTKATNRAAADPDSPCTLALWSAINGQRASTSALSSWGLRVTEGFAFKPGTAELAVACPFRYYSPNASTAIADTVYRLEVYSLGRRERLLKQDVGVRAPVCWSPDGSFLVGVSTRDPSRLVTVAVGKDFAKVEKVLPRHVDEVTQLAFLPRGSVAVGNVDAVVSAGKDGYVRVTNVESGRTLFKIEVGARAPAGMMQVSPDGTLVVTVWGRDVVLWWLDSGRVHTYNLNVVRQTEGWPLCVSPDCRYLACRTEEGFDVSDVLTGKFRGEFTWTGQFLSAAAFSSDGRRLAMGDYVGGLHMFEVVTP